MLPPNYSLYRPPEQPGCACTQAQGCEKISCQYATVSVPIELKPAAEVGKIIAECCGEPQICCKTNPCENFCENFCEITVIQRICIKIPICYSVAANVKSSQIDCALGGCGE